MCGIVGAVAQRDVAPILLEGLKRLEYRGYDSAGIAVLDAKHCIHRFRSVGKVKDLAQKIISKPLTGNTGIGHTRWATHGKPCEANAHPHMSGDGIAIVHNGIIENYLEHKQFLAGLGYRFNSDTDTEVVAHLLHYYLAKGENFLSAVQHAVHNLDGAFALAFISKHDPGRVLAVRKGSPLVIGIGIGEHFIASDPIALLPVTQQFIYLEEGDIADVKSDQVSLYDKQGRQVERALHISRLNHEHAERGEYRHFMQKEIFAQPMAISNTLQERIGQHKVFEQAFGNHASATFDAIERVQITACGTSYYAGLVGKYWMEEIAGLLCQVEVASEHRYRKEVVQPNTLFVAISQSGETADTLGALQAAKQKGYKSTLAICNVPESSLVRNSDLVLLTGAGTEIGVASTKAFTTQLVAILLLTLVLGRRHKLTEEAEAKIVKELHEVSQRIEQVLALEPEIKSLANQFMHKHHALFLGRGIHYPIALEGALKLKEVSYIHAEGYPAGELKHGPLALVDPEMLIVALAPNNELLEKLNSNLQEVSARGGTLIIFTDVNAKVNAFPGAHVIRLPLLETPLAPIFYAIPLQLLAYHVAVIKGTDVDQPRNLAKSVTVE